MSSTTGPTARFILMPLRGFESEDMKQVDAADATFTKAARERLRASSSSGRAREPFLKLVHAMGSTGPRLVELGPEEVAALRVAAPGVRVLPLIKYELMRLPRLEVTSRPAQATGKLQISFVDAKTRKPVAGVYVAAFTNFEARQGAGGTSNAKGVVTLTLGTGPVKIDLMAAYGPAGYWGCGRKGFTMTSGDVFELEPVDVTVPDFAAHLYSGYAEDGGKGVTVGVLDTGIDDAHPDLEVAGGGAFVTSEQDEGGSGPARTEGDHGTHVAGIIASRGRSEPKEAGGRPGKRGIAPQVRLMSYRVFPNDGSGADNYDIVRAIDQGVKDGCDLLNLSLGSAYADPAVHEAMKAAFDQGTLCICAAGNEDRSPVSYPAAWDIAVAVSSLGRRGTYPAQSTESLDEVEPFSTVDPAIYVSAFSNVGPEIDVSGPGGGIVSTLPGGGYGVMSGTSMACPAVVGAVASLLSANRQILDMPRGRERAVAIRGLIAGAAQTLGLMPTLEGVGLIR